MFRNEAVKLLSGIQKGDRKGPVSPSNLHFLGAPVSAFLLLLGGGCSESAGCMAGTGPWFICRFLSTNHNENQNITKVP